MSATGCNGSGPRSGRSLLLDPHNGGSDQGESSRGLVGSIVAALRPKDTRGQQLHFCTLTANPGTGAIPFRLPGYVELIAEAGGSCVLVQEAGGSHDTPHAHALVQVPDGCNPIDYWLVLAEVRRRSQRRRKVKGWKRLLERGDGRLLLEDLERITRYMLKAPRASWSCGVLAAPWRAFVGGSEVRAVRQPKARARAAQWLRRGPAPGTCGWCGGSLDGKRSDAKYCRASHKVRACEARRGVS
jgi:hypothetical protein